MFSCWLKNMLWWKCRNASLWAERHEMKAGNNFTAWPASGGEHHVVILKWHREEPGRRMTHCHILPHAASYPSLSNNRCVSCGSSRRVSRRLVLTDVYMTMWGGFCTLTSHSFNITLVSGLEKTRCLNFIKTTYATKYTSTTFSTQPNNLRLLSVGACNKLHFNYF